MAKETTFTSGQVYESHDLNQSFSVKSYSKIGWSLLLLAGSTLGATSACGDDLRLGDVLGGSFLAITSPPISQDSLERMRAPDGRTLRAIGEKAISLARKDSKAALEFVNSHCPERERTEIKVLISTVLCEEDVERFRIVPELFPTVGEPDSPDDNAAIFALNQICAFWVGKDPKVIVRYAGRMESTPLRKQLVQVLLDYLERAHHLQEAIHLIVHLRGVAIPPPTIAGIALEASGDDRTELFFGLSKFSSRAALMVYQDMASKFEAANDVTELQKLTGFAEKPTKPIVLRSIGALLGRSLPVQPSEWAAARGYTGGDRAYVVIGSLKTAPQTELRRLIAEALVCDEINTRATAAQAYLGRLFFLDRQEAIDWTLNSPADVRFSALLTIVGHWYAQDKEGLSQWISSLDHGHDRDTAMNLYCEELGPTNLILARKSAGEIDDLNLREETFKSLDEVERLHPESKR